MYYISTRGNVARAKFCDILLAGLAPDGGLYLPERYPHVGKIALAGLRDVYCQQGYAELAYRILDLYIDDIPGLDLRRLCHNTYSNNTFGTMAATPLAAAPSRRCVCSVMVSGYKPCRAALPWPSKTLLCSYWAICLSTS